MVETRRTALAEAPAVIQGGMGVGVSGWKLANEVSRSGGLGVVSGTALDLMLTRRLQNGDVTGDIREALAAFPYQGTAQRILQRYLKVPSTAGEAITFRPTPQMGLRASKVRDELMVAANFVEVYLARRGHDGPVGINYLEKIQLATAASVYGAMLAGVDYILMGAGVPAQIPRLLDAFASGEKGSIDLTVEGAHTGERFYVGFDPAAVFGAAPTLARPHFLAVVASHAIAAYLARDTATCPDGFIVETPIAGGHSARPRGPGTFDELGQPIYGPRDEADLEKFRKLGRPFWLAGGFGTPQQLCAAQAAGATGVQVGTAFALSRDSGITDEVRAQLLRAAQAGELTVRNDALASPTGFPFKMVTLPATVGVDEVYADRDRNCDLGYLRSAYRKDDGRVGYRCPSEPADVYVAKGGDLADTIGRRCVCNGLAATIGLPQTRPDGYTEVPLVTLGQDLDFLTVLLPNGAMSYGARDVMAYLTGD